MNIHGHKITPPILINKIPPSQDEKRAKYIN
jgi:hypothetical protein